MYLYIIFVILLFISFLEVNSKHKRLNEIFYLVILFFFVISSLRWERGTDWISYKSFFDNIKYYPSGVFEYFYTLLNKITYSISKDYTLFLCIQSLLVYIPFAYIIKKYAHFPIFATLIWFSINFAGIFSVRQTIAISFVFLSLDFLLNRRLLFFMLTVFAASLFHRTALVFIPTYFIYSLNLSKRNFIIILILAFSLSSIFSILFQQLAGMGLGVFTIKLNAYLDSDITDSAGSNFTPFQTMIRGVSYRVVIFILILTFLYDYYKNDLSFKYFFNLYFYGIIIFILLVPIAVGFGRLAPYFEIFQLLLFTQLLFLIKDKTNRFLIFSFLILYFSFRLYSNIYAYKDLYIPYKSIFNKELPVKF